MGIAPLARDLVAGPEHRDDAPRFLEDLGERFAKFALGLHPGEGRD